ncbi:MAG: hypothetical protein V3T58_01080 [Candidatus Hydrothermarchaeales archaeon]
MNTLEELGDGKVIEIESGATIFKLESDEKNPIVRPQDLGLTWNENGESKIGAVFNGGAEFFENKVILLPRCHRDYRKGEFFDEKLGIERTCLENYISEVWPLVSEDGVHFTRFHNVVIRGDGTDHQDFTYGIEDIRIVKYGRRYLLIGCGKIKPPFKGGNADRIAIYTTKDFVKINYQGIVDSFDSRNAVPFSEPVNGQHWILLRFHTNIHIDFLEAGINQLLNPSQHTEQWDEIYERQSQNLLLEAGHYPHEKQKIGPGPQVLRTDRGWLLIYHAVGEIEYNICKAYGLTEKIERGYSICAALLDLDDPRKVLCRTRNPIYIPSTPYELYGNDQYPVDVSAVVFPMGAIVRKEKLILYAGAGDKYIILLSCDLDNLVNYLWEYCKYIA